MPTAGEVRAEMKRILASTDFLASRQLTRFLRYVIDTALAGHAARIKERTVAIHALDRDSDFDPRIDPIVRMVAGKLRRALQRFYAGEGSDSLLQIDMPKGGYRPQFTFIGTRFLPAVPKSANGHNGQPENLPSDSPAALPDVALPDFHRMTALPVLAVIPFVSFTAGAEERLLADSIPQDVCVGLSKFNWFQVVDYLAARARCQGRYVATDVAARLHADFCLTGSVRCHAGMARVSVHLTDTASGSVLWADTFDLSIEAPTFAACDLATQRIVAMVGDIFGVLGTAVWNQARAKPIHQLTTTEAVLCNLRYQSKLSDGIYPDAVKTARRALKADPDFAWGWAAMATLYLDGFAMVAKGGPRNASQQAEECIRRALQADPTSAFAHWTMGLYHLMHGRTEEALEAGERAVEHAQGMPFETGAAGTLLATCGAHEQGQSLIDQALAVNPRLPGWIHWGSVINYLQRGESERALAVVRKFSLPDCFWDHLLNAAALQLSGESNQASDAVHRARQLRPELAERPRELVTKIVQQADVQEQILHSLEVAWAE